METCRLHCVASTHCNLWGSCMYTHTYNIYICMQIVIQGYYGHFRLAKGNFFSMVRPPYNSIHRLILWQDGHGWAPRGIQTRWWWPRWKIDLVACVAGFWAPWWSLASHLFGGYIPLETWQKKACDQIRWVWPSRVISTDSADAVHFSVREQGTGTANTNTSAFQGYLVGTKKSSFGIEIPLRLHMFRFHVWFLGANNVPCSGGQTIIGDAFLEPQH